MGQNETFHQQSGFEVPRFFSPIIKPEATQSQQFPYPSHFLPSRHHPWVTSRALQKYRRRIAWGRPGSSRGRCAVNSMYAGIVGGHPRSFSCAGWRVGGMVVRGGIVLRVVEKNSGRDVDVPTGEIHALKILEFIRKYISGRRNLYKVIVKDRPARLLPMRSQRGCWIGPLGVRCDQRGERWVPCHTEFWISLGVIYVNTGERMNEGIAGLPRKRRYRLYVEPWQSQARASTSRTNAQLELQNKKPLINSLTLAQIIK